MSNKLEEARKIINEVDAQMAELFVKRMRAAEMVSEHKKMYGLPILDAARENAVIEKNTALIEDEVLKEYYIDFIKNMMATSRAYQYRLHQGLKVAYSGVPGAFAHIAAGRVFPEASRVPYRDFKAAYNAATVEDIKKVTSHPQALSQCHDYIQLRGFDTEEANNTASAAKTVFKSKDKTSKTPVTRLVLRLFTTSLCDFNACLSSIRHHTFSKPVCGLFL